MKTLITLFILASLAFPKDQETLSIKAAFFGHEDGFYYFTDYNDNSFFFEGIEAAAKEKFDLTKKNLCTKNLTSPTRLKLQKANMERNITLQLLLIWCWKSNF